MNQHAKIILKTCFFIIFFLVFIDLNKYDHPRLSCFLILCVVTCENMFLLEKRRCVSYM